MNYFRFPCIMHAIKTRAVNIGTQENIWKEKISKAKSRCGVEWEEATVVMIVIFIMRKPCAVY